MLFRRDFLRNASAAVLAPAVLLRAQTATAQSGRTVRIGVVSPLNAFDPIRFSEAFIMRAVFPPLTRITTRTGDPLSGWEPYAGTPTQKLGWQASTPYIDITPTPTRVWHQGQSHTLDDIMRGIERARQRLRAIDIVDNIKKLTIESGACRVYLHNPDTRPYKEIFARSWTSPLSTDLEAALVNPPDQIPKFSRTLGPYVFADPCIPGDVITLKANPAWKQRGAGVDVFSIRRYPTVRLLTAAFSAHAADLVFLPSDRIQADESVGPAEFQALATVEKDITSAVSYVAIESGTGVTADPRVRQAFRAGIDPAKVAEVAYGTHAEPTSDILPAGFLKERPSARRWYDPGRALQLLAEAGRGDGFEGRLVVLQSASDSERRAAENIIDQLGAIRIRLTLEFTTFQVNRPEPSTRSTFFLVRTPLVQTPGQAFASFTTPAPQNIARFSSAEYDKTVQEITSAGEGWEKLVQQARAILDREAVLVPLLQPRNYLFAQRGLRASFALDGTPGDLADVVWG
jgi:Bacterial extracellular solute-binding proteins, family 5 Middle